MWQRDRGQGEVQGHTVTHPMNDLVPEGNHHAVDPLLHPQGVDGVRHARACRHLVGG